MEVWMTTPYSDGAVGAIVQHWGIPLTVMGPAENGHGSLLVGEVDDDLGKIEIANGRVLAMDRMSPGTKLIYEAGMVEVTAQKTGKVSMSPAAMAARVHRPATESAASPTPVATRAKPVVVPPKPGADAKGPAAVAQATKQPGAAVQGPAAAAQKS